MFPIATLIFRPSGVHEVAAKRADTSAFVVNAVNGIFVVAAVALPLLPLFTISAITLLTILFGPLVGFVVSSLYSRVEHTIGKRLGGKASHDQLYNIFAWSFFAMGFAALLYGLIIFTFNKPSTSPEFIASIPSLIIICFTIKKYCSNIIALQQFTRTRVIVSVFLSFMVFLFFIAISIGFLWLLFRYGMGETTKFSLNFFFT
jgi:hypothetical protein